MILTFKRKRPGPRRGIRRPTAAILAERTARDRRDVETAAAIHAAWLASRASAGVPDLAYLEAARVAQQAHIEEVRLLAELRAELAAERQQQSSETTKRPTVYVPAGRPRMGPSLAPPDSQWS